MSYIIIAAQRREFDGDKIQKTKKQQYSARNSVVNINNAITNNISSINNIKK